MLKLSPYCSIALCFSNQFGADFCARFLYFRIVSNIASDILHGRPEALKTSGFVMGLVLSLYSETHGYGLGMPDIGNASSVHNLYNKTCKYMKKTNLDKFDQNMCSINISVYKY